MNKNWKYLDSHSLNPELQKIIKNILDKKLNDKNINLSLYFLGVNLYTPIIITNTEEHPTEIAIGISMDATGKLTMVGYNEKEHFANSLKDFTRKSYDHFIYFCENEKELIQLLDFLQGDIETFLN